MTGWLAQRRYREIGAVVLLVAVVGLLYGQTLHAPFYLDDLETIQENPLLRDLWAAFGQIGQRRGLAQFSYALNMWCFGPSLPAYHLVNLALHLASGLLFWRLLLRLFASEGLAALGALLFVAHPLQTQAVLYLIQRAVLLSTLLALAALLLYWRWSEAPQRRWSYLGALLCGGLAVLAKENLAPLAVLLLVCDRLVIHPDRRSWRPALLAIAPLLLVPLFLAGQLLWQSRAPGAYLSLHSDLASLVHNTPVNYLFTQFQVVWVYVRLVILPYGQALEHNFAVVEHWWQPLSLLGLGGVALVTWWGVRYRRRAPLTVLGLTWFALGLVVESSIIPLDPLFEHRLYFPLGGLLLAVLDQLRRSCGERRALWFATAAVLCCLPLTWQRASLWNDPIAFYEDNLAKVPDSERVRINLAKEHVEHGNLARAEAILTETIRLYPRTGAAYNNLGMIRFYQKRYDEAVAILDQGVRNKPDDPEVYMSAAKLRVMLGDFNGALDYLQRAQAVDPDRGATLNNLGVVYSKMGRWHDAEGVYRESLKLFPENPVAWDNLGETLVQQGRVGESLAAFRRAVELDPGNPQLLINLGLNAARVGDKSTVQMALAKLRPLDRRAAAELEKALNAR